MRHVENKFGIVRRLKDAEYIKYLSAKACGDEATAEAMLGNGRRVCMIDCSDEWLKCDAAREMLDKELENRKTGPRKPKCTCVLTRCLACLLAKKGRKA